MVHSLIYSVGKLGRTRCSQKCLSSLLANRTVFNLLYVTLSLECPPNVESWNESSNLVLSVVVLPIKILPLYLMILFTMVKCSTTDGLILNCSSSSLHFESEAYLSSTSFI
jgi:hypothetical protein